MQRAGKPDKASCGVRAKLDLPNANQSLSGSVIPDEQSLLEVAEQCSRTADQLVEKLHCLKIDGPHKKRQAVLKTVRLLWEKGEIQEFQKRLDSYRNMLDSQILINIRQRLDLISLQHSKGFQDLDQKIQKLITSLAQGPRSFQELNDLIQDENEKTRDHVSIKFQEHERRLAEEEYHSNLLKSLWFAEILSREETIAEAHSETFQWIFDKSGQAVRPWNNFIAWLEKGEGIYWISGKAGSGKSTLMNYLCQEERTLEALTIWSGTKDILMPKFFFWSAGTSMQRSLEGLLRSLLWQILHEISDENILPSDIGSRSEQGRRVPPNHNMIGAWTKSRLQKTLQQVINQLRNSCRFCFFIDGLDEFDEDDDDVITFVQELVSSIGVKVCSSSRPHKAFEDAFSSSAKLRLQDLTYKDIKRYVTDKFEGVPQLRTMTTDHEYDMDNLKREIVFRAEGIFLWVSLAVKDQIRGLRNEDTPEQLQERLASLPSEVEGIYFRMLLQIDKSYLQEASHFLQMALHKPSLSLLEHSLASYKGLEHVLLSADNLTRGEIVSMCQLTRKRIITTCIGLLEVHEPYLYIYATSSGTSGQDSLQSDAGPEDDLPDFDAEKDIVLDQDHMLELLHPVPDADDSIPSSESASTDDETFNLETNFRVNFSHRTVVDFLTSVVPAEEFLEANLPPDFDPQVIYVKALLGKLRFRGQLDLNSCIDRVMYEVVIAEDRTGNAQIGLCDLIDRTMSNLYLAHPNWYPNSHWSEHWGKLAEIWVREQDISTLSTTSSSRSSSRDSYYTATSQCANVGTAPTGPMDILSFAALHGLSLYVQQVLDCRQEKISPEKLDYMLWCSTVYLSDLAQRDYMRLRVVPYLLRQGANPNAKFFTTSIWRRFLEAMAIFWIGSFLRCNNVMYYTMYYELFRSAIPSLTQTVSSFIEYGADVGSIWTFHIRPQVPDNYEFTGPWAGVSAFDIRLSALSLVQLLWRHESALPRIREMCVARDAVSYMKCQILELGTINETEEDAEYLKRYELSEQESQDFVEILEHFLDLREKEPEAGTYCWSQMSRLFERLDENRLNTSAAPRMKASIVRRSEEGSEWRTRRPCFQSVTTGIGESRSWNRREFHDALPSQSQPDETENSHEWFRNDTLSAHSSLEP